MTVAIDPASGAAGEVHTADATREQSITLVLPAFNEAPVIEQAIREAHQALGALCKDFEILVIDDGSSDGTHLIAQALAAELGRVEVIRQPRNLGYGAALRTGFQAATKSLVVFTDADCQFDLRELDRHLLLARNYDIVCGYRIDRQDPPHRKFYSRCYNLAVRSLLGTAVRDCDCALKMFRRQTIQSITSQANGFFINAEILSRARMQQATIAEVGVTHRPRLKGESTVSLRHVVPVGKDLLRFWWQEIQFPSKSIAIPRWSLGMQWSGMIAILALGAWILLRNLGYPLIEPDETRYAQIPLTMITSGDWVTPQLDGRPYLDKPPLLYWMVASSYRLFGINERAARLPGAVAALLTVLATFALGQRLIGSRAAWLGALMLLVSGGFVLSGRFVLMDGPLTMLTTIGYLSCLLALQGGKIRRGWWLLGSVACGLGILMKGPVAPVLMLPPLIASLFLRAHRPRIRMADAILFAVPVLAISMPWFILISKAHVEFGSYFFWKHHIQRFTSAFNHKEPWWYFLPVLWAGFFPVSLLLPLFSYFLISKSSSERESRTENLGAILLGGLWTVFFFSLSSCKLPTYILPAFPLLALGMGLMLDRGLASSGVPNRLSMLLKSMPQWANPIVVFAGLVVMLLDVFLTTESSVNLLVDVATAIAVLTIMILTLWRLRAFEASSWASTALFCIAGMIITFGNFVPELAQMRSIHAEVRQLHELHPQATVIYFGHRPHSVELHMDQEDFVEIPADEPSQLSQFLKTHPQSILVSPPALANQILQPQAATFVQNSTYGRGYVHLLNSGGKLSRR
jgi:dolichol-phosphate mannosyltransferase